jgi:hypothetical protein
MLINRDMFFYYAGKLIPALGALVLMWIGIKYLGEASYGKYILIFNSITLVTAFTAGWIQQGMLRFNAEQLGVPNIFRNSSYSRMTFIAALLSFFLMLILAVVYFKLEGIEILISSVVAFLFCYYSVGLSGLQSQFKSAKYAISESLFSIGTIATCGLLLVVLGFTSYHVMLIGILIGCLVSLIFGIQPAIQRNISNGQIDQSLGMKFLKFGFPITVWLFISNLFNLADRFLIEHFFNLEVVGTYSAVYDFIYKISGFLCMPVLLAFHPAITKKWNDGFSEDAFRLIKKALFFEVLLTVAVAIFFYFFGEYFFHTVIHLKATNLLGMIVPLVISSMLWQMAMLIHKPLELHLATLVMLLGITLSMLFNIALNIYLLPIYGYQIAAITTLAGTCFYIIYTLFANRLVTNKFRK